MDWLNSLLSSPAATPFFVVVGLVTVVLFLIEVRKVFKILSEKEDDGEF